MGHARKSAQSRKGHYAHIPSKRTLAVFILSEKQAPLPARRMYKKSTNGCAACKRRKVKCDEARPVCYNCSIRFRGVQTCEWPHAKNRPLQPDSSKMLRSNMLPPPLSSSLSSAEHVKEGYTSSITSSSTSIGSYEVANTLDPFCSLPPTLVPNAQELFHHYITIAAWEYFPAPRRKQATNPLLASWSTLAGADPLLFHSNLQISARSLERREGIKWSTHSHIAARECVRLLRERVQDPVLGISNHSLGAIARMMEVEYDRGNARAVRTHLGGLKSIVKLRGGLDSIRKSCPITMTTVTWRTLLITNLCPFQPRCTKSSGDLNWVQTMLPPNSAGTKLPSATELYIDKATWEGLAIIRSHAVQISRTLQAGDEPNLTSTEAIAALFWQCYTWFPSEVSVSLSDATRLTTVLFLCISNPDSRCFLFDHPSGAQSAKKIISGLRTALEPALDLDLAREEFVSASALLLWNLVIGALAAQRMMERKWFIEGLRHVVRLLGINGWTELKELLVGFVWLELWHDELGKRLWEEATMGSVGDIANYTTSGNEEIREPAADNSTPNSLFVIH